MSVTARHDVPDGAHETVDEELVLFCGCLFSRIPDFAIATLHEPLLQVDRVRDVGICGKRVGGQRERFERRVEVGNAVLREQTDEVQSADGVLARGRWQDGATRELGQFVHEPKERGTCL